MTFAWAGFGVRVNPLIHGPDMKRRRNVFLLAAFFWTAAISAHANTLPDPEPATPTGTYDLTPMPAGTTCTVVVVPAPFCGPTGPWFGYVYLNAAPVGPETMVIMRSSAGGYVWQNSKVGPRTGLNGAGTLEWDGSRPGTWLTLETSDMPDGSLQRTDDIPDSVAREAAPCRGPRPMR